MKYLLVFLVFNASIACRTTSNDSASLKDGVTTISGEVTCVTPSQRITFKPQYGEVHFESTVNGPSYHDDGLNFDELILESYPPQIRMTIKDDDGENVGGWGYIQGDATFTVNYQGERYSGCQSQGSRDGGGDSGGSDDGSRSREVVCMTSTQRITFKPQFGEVHFESLVNGPSDHDDGLNFDEMILESYPPQIRVTIENDEGENVGGWGYIQGDATFTVNYQGERYSGCQTHGSSAGSGSDDGSRSREVVCMTSTQRITFKPQFGEVHFESLANGPSDHDDGLNFDELILESYPPQIRMTIKNDEGENVGGWGYTQGDATFTVNYQGERYSGCRLRQ